MKMGLFCATFASFFGAATTFFGAFIRLRSSGDFGAAPAARTGPEHQAASGFTRKPRGA